MCITSWAAPASNKCTEAATYAGRKQAGGKQTHVNSRTTAGEPRTMSYCSNGKEQDDGKIPGHFRPAQGKHKICATLCSVTFELTPMAVYISATTQHEPCVCLTMPAATASLAPDQEDHDMYGKVCDARTQNFQSVQLLKSRCSWQPASLVLVFRASAHRRQSPLGHMNDQSALCQPPSLVQQRG